MEKISGYKITKEIKLAGELSIYDAVDKNGNRVVIKFYNKNNLSAEEFKYYQTNKKIFTGEKIFGFIRIIDTGDYKTNYYVILEKFESISLKEIISKKKLSIINFLRIAIKIIKILKFAEKYGIQINYIDADNIFINLKKGRVKFELIYNQNKKLLKPDIGKLFFYMITGSEYKNNIEMISFNSTEKNINFYKEIKNLIEGMINNHEFYFNNNLLNKHLEKILNEYNDFIKKKNNLKVKNIKKTENKFLGKSFFNIYKKKILLTVLIVILAGIIFSIYKDVNLGSSRSEEKIKLIDVNITKVKKINIEKKIRTMGSIIYRDKVAISSKIIGRIKNIYVEQGDFVKNGELLAKVDTMSIQLELKEMRSELKSAIASYRLVKEKMNNAKRDIERDIKNLSKLKIKYKEKYNIMKNEKDIFYKQKKIYKAGGVTETDLNRFKLKYLSSITDFHIAKKEFEIKKIGYRNFDIKKAGYKKIKDKKVRNEILKTINTRVQKAEADVAYNYISKIKTKIEILKNNIKEGYIKSPISGIVGIRNIERGEFIKTDRDLFLIMNLKEVFLIINPGEKDALKIKIGQNVNLNVDAIDNKKFSGKVFLISPLLDEKTRTIEIKILIKNNKKLLKPGMFVRAHITTDKFINKIFLKEKDILKIGNKSYVFVNIKGTVYKKKIITGEKINARTEIISGVKEGEIIASSNIHLLSDKMKIHPVLKNKAIVRNMEAK